MQLAEKLHAYHRFWRFRLRTEPREIRFMLAQNLRGGTILDVGANRGGYAYWMHRAAGAAGRVVAFEPQPELINYLSQLKHAFRLHQLTIVGSGVSDRAGELTLVRPRRHWGGGSFHLDPQAPDCDLLRVPVTTLDEYFARHDLPPVRFIKCDVQDHEAHVFRGASRLLAEQRPTLLFEETDACVAEGSAAAFLNELGYRGYFFSGRQLVPIAELPHLRKQIAAPHLNFVYRHEAARQYRRAA